MTEVAEQHAAWQPTNRGVRACRLCGRTIRVVTDVHSHKPVALDVPAAGVDHVYPWWDGPSGLQGRASGAWLWAAIQQAPPAAAAMAALDVEIDAPALAALESLGGFGVNHAATCPARTLRLGAACREAAAELRGEMTRAKANEIADRLEAAAGKERPT